MAFWVEFSDRDPGCIHLPRMENVSSLWKDPAKPFGEGNYADPEKVKAWVMQRAKDLTGKNPIAIHSLPYGASPALDQQQFGDFCYSPNTCKGRGSCPKNPACSE